jgi:hypothetical protein
MSTAKPDIVTAEQWRTAPQTPPYTWSGWHDKHDHTL